MKIKLYKKNPNCPDCKVPLGYDRQAVKHNGDTHMFYMSEIEAIYRCPKCFNLYEVKE